MFPLARLSLLATLCVALPAAALPERDGACSAHPVQWLCVGHIQLRSPKATIGMTGYENKEVLVELDRGGTRTRLLVTAGGAFVDARPTHPDFDFWTHAFATPLLLLPKAFPAGPHTVPAEPETHTFALDARIRASVTARRDVDGEIHFAIVMDAAPPIEGSYRAGLLPALPGDFDLRGWYVPLGPQKVGAPPQQPQPAPVERLEQLR